LIKYYQQRCNTNKKFKLGSSVRNLICVKYLIFNFFLSFFSNNKYIKFIKILTKKIIIYKNFQHKNKLFSFKHFYKIKLLKY